MGEKMGFIPEQLKDAVGAQSADAKRAAQRKVYELAQKIEEGGRLEEAVALIRDVNLSYLEIARAVLPSELVERYPDVCKGVIKALAQKHIPQEERQQLTHTRLSKAAKRQIENDPEAHQRKSQRGTEKSSQRSAEQIAEALTNAQKARGIIEWKEGERALLFTLTTDPAFQHGPGPYLGKPNYQKIANELNRKLHGGEVVREPKKLGRVVVSDRYDQKIGRRKKSSKEESGV